MDNQILLGDCISVMKDMHDNSVDGIVTDPPYELGFMGKKWDNSGIAYNVDVWKECLRVLKPGGHLLAFGGTRTYHRMAVAIEDAGFEIRDMIEWVYGSGFPKSLNIGKAIQKHQGVEMEDTGVISPISRPNVSDDLYKSGKVGKNFTLKNVTTAEAKKYEGFGTALKPSHEPICMARKPLSEKTVAQNCLKWGTGGINIDESRVGSEVISQHGRKAKDGGGWENHWHNDLEKGKQWEGRFPANLIHDNSEEVRECFPEQKNGAMTKAYKYTNNGYSLGKPTGETKQIHESNSGNASRFFKSIIYQAKASKAERGKGNNHPTVKPVALMEYLIKMVTPKGGVVLDPFGGSGTTALASLKTGNCFVVIEMQAEYVDITQKRVQEFHANNQLKLDYGNNII